MLCLFQSLRPAMPLASGAVLGMAITWWTAVHASSLLPTLTLTTVADGQTVSGVVTLAAQASSAGFSTIQFQASGQNVGPTITSGACSTPWNTASMVNGSHTVAAVAADSLGNTVWTTPVVVTVQNMATGDSTAPTVAVIAPTAGATVSGTLTLSASASDNIGVAGVWFTVDGATVGAEDGSVPYTVQWTTTSVEGGSHVVSALARDTSGNTASSSAVIVTVTNVTGDTTAPTVSVTAPSSDAVLSGSVAVAAAAADAVGVTSVQFTLDGANLGLADTSAPYSVTWNTTTASNAPHVLGAVARDAAGNARTSSRSVTVDNTNGRKKRPGRP